jgi:hypothetical protein
MSGFAFLQNFIAKMLAKSPSASVILFVAAMLVFAVDAQAPGMCKHHFKLIGFRL